MREPDDSQRQVYVTAVTALSAWAAQLEWVDVADDARDRFTMLLHDTLAVTWAGSRVPENGALVEAWPASPGPATALGTGECATERAAWLNGVASVSLEMDCASRTTRGHAAAHSFFAVLALAQERGSEASLTMASLLVAHEVASRFGRASRLAPGLHPHGSWGAAGAAAGAARVAGLDAGGLARAVDVAGGLMLAAPFVAATSGNAVRNHWVGFSNVAGVIAARTAQALPGAHLTAPAVDAYHHALGSLDASSLADGLDHDSRGAGLALQGDFVKRHAACGYSHALLDAVLEARAHPDWPADAREIEAIDLETNETSAELAGLRCDSRLAAMFSLDYLVAATALLGETGPRATDQSTRENPEVLALARRVNVSVAADLQARMPLDRGGRVRIHRSDRPSLVVEVPNARWDPRYHPATWDDVRGKARGLLEPHGGDEQALFDWVTAMSSATGPVPDLADAVGPPRTTTAQVRGRA